LKQNAGHHPSYMPGLQAAQLLDDEEQEEHDREAGAEKILQVLQASHGPQGDQGLTALIVAGQ
jgi:hypothetical protein